ncbi:MAG: 3'(2'),5'-bisphosphate nucleotidase CysQ [Bacilli bacterium]|jgi:3'(2'), 5'-bisphosphate nucleotidase|nr:3'(2'),5'-bisphosphate nucleotidase CysQ [Bacilli bacterium]
MEFADVFLAMKEAVKTAMDTVLGIYEGHYSVTYKSDSSPLTTADLASNQILRDKLSPFSTIGWLSEEDSDDFARLSKSLIFIVDPLDGTQDFVNRNGSFGINLALVKDHQPVIAFIGMPVLHSYCYALSGQGAFVVDASGKETPLHVSSRTDKLIYLASRTHDNDEERAVITRHPDRISQVIRQGASIKAYYLASGQADASVRYTKMTKEWDVCAPDLVVREAGGIFMDTKKKPFVYNRQDVYNHDGYCMFNRPENEDLLE